MATSFSLSWLLIWIGVLGIALPGRIESPSPRERTTGLTAAARPCAESGVLEDIAVPTAYLDAREIVAQVYLPPCYDAHAEPGYPLLVLIHGQGYTPRQWLDMGLPQRLDAWIRQSRTPPFVVLMPYDPPPAMRPPHSGFDEALMEDLLPWVEAHYAVRPERAYRAVGGISRGAAWAIHLGLRHWEQFGSIGGHSPPVFWSDGLHVAEWLKAIPSDQWPRLYLDIGDGDRQDILRSALEFEDLLTDLGVPHEWHFNVGRHEPSYWQAHLDAYLRWYTSAWASENPASTPEEPR